jgi:S-adenosylmethionine hydrolase
MAIITLTTDFGYRDGYVGALKGVIARITPSATVVDIAHDVPRGDVAHAAWVLATSTMEFPHGTIHVVVVDPGVGGERRAVIAQVTPKQPRGAQFYVGPDNGVFSYLPISRAWLVDPRKLGKVSPTFHGRDVFAPVAASIAKQHGEFYGEDTKLTGTLPWATTGTHVVHVDHYGNLITNHRPDPVPKVIAIAGAKIPVVRTYESVKTGELLAYVGSSGTIEIAVRDGRADKHLGIERGAQLALEEGPYR